MEFSILTALIAALILISAFFSAMETALFSLQPVQLRRIRNRKLAAALERLLENPRRLLSVLLLGDAFANLPLMILCLLLLRESLPNGLPFWACALVIFGIVVLLCDLLPKMAALRAPFRVAALGARPLHFLLPVFDPLCRRLQSASERMADALAPKALDTHRPLNEE